MLKSAEIADPKSCLNSARDDEPIFVLRANDELAPQFLRQWAHAYHDQKAAAAPSRTLTDAQLQKYRTALALADTFDRWRMDRVHEAEEAAKASSTTAAAT